MTKKNTNTDNTDNIDNIDTNNTFTALDAFSSFLGEDNELPQNWTIDYDKVYKALAFALRDLAFANRDKFPQFHPNGRFDQEAFNESFKLHFGTYNEYRFTEEELLEVGRKRLRMTKADLITLHDQKIEFFTKVGAGKNGKKYQPQYQPSPQSSPTEDEEPMY